MMTLPFLLVFVHIFSVFPMDTSLCSLHGGLLFQVKTISVGHKLVKVCL